MDRHQILNRRLSTWIVVAFVVFTTEINVNPWSVSVSSHLLHAGEKVRLVKGARPVQQVTFENDPHSAGEYASSINENLKNALIGQSADMAAMKSRGCIPLLHVAK